MRPYLTPDRYSSYTLCNLYYDTADWQLIRTCLEKPVYKEKLRVRSYGVPGDGDRVFLEIKKKYAGIVYKRRITAAVQDAAGLLAQDLPVRAAGQIGAEIAQFQARYRAQPRVFLAYDRQAFSGAQDTGLRVTFDTNLRWRQTEAGPTPRRSRRASAAAGRCSAGEQAPRCLPALAEPSALGAGHFPRLVFQIWRLLPTEACKGGAALCLILSWARA